MLTILRLQCHEVGHAVHFYKEGISKWEPIFEYQHFNEMGYAFERLVFGSHFSFLSIPGRPVPPNSIKTAKGILIAKIPHDHDTRVARQDIYIVQWEWLLLMFDHQFWSKEPWPEQEEFLFPRLQHYVTIRRPDKPTLVWLAEPI